MFLSQIESEIHRFQWSKVASKKQGILWACLLIKQAQRMNTIPTFICSVLPKKRYVFPVYNESDYS